MMTRTVISVLAALLVAGLALAPSGAAEEQTIRPSQVEFSLLGAAGTGGSTDSGHEASCGGIAPIEPCETSLFLPLSVTQLSLGAAISPGFTGWVLIKLSTAPYSIDIRCEILAGGVGPATCAVVGGQGVLIGTTMTMTITFDPVAVGQYEFTVSHNG